MTSAAADQFARPPLHCTNLRALALQGQRHASPEVVVELIPAGPAPHPRITFDLEDVTMMLAFGPCTARESVADGPPQAVSFARRAHFLPAHHEVTAELDWLPEFLGIAMAPAFVERTFEELLDGRPVQQRFLARNASPSLLDLGKSLRCRMLSGQPLPKLVLESFAQLCLADWSEALAEPMPAAPAQPGLRAWGQVDDYIQANLDQDISLAQLAQIAELSPSHFLRAFKQATGLTPHRYLTSCRLQRARSLLADSDRSIVEIAYACGFASQSHMTDVFKRHFAISPGRYRASCRI